MASPRSRDAAGRLRGVVGTQQRLVGRAVGPEEADGSAVPRERRGSGGRAGDPEVAIEEHQRPRGPHPVAVEQQPDVVSLGGLADVEEQVVAEGDPEVLMGLGVQVRGEAVGNSLVALAELPHRGVGHHPIGLVAAAKEGRRELGGGREGAAGERPAGLSYVDVRVVAVAVFGERPVADRHEPQPPVGTPGGGSVAAPPTVGQAHRGGQSIVTSVDQADGPERLALALGQAHRERDARALVVDGGVSHLHGALVERLGEVPRATVGCRGGEEVEVTAGDEAVVFDNTRRAEGPRHEDHRLDGTLASPWRPPPPLGPRPLHHGVGERVFERGGKGHRPVASAGARGGGRSRAGA